MKQECPTYLKTIGKSKAFSTTLSDTELEDELDDNNDEGILNAFTAIVNPTEGIVEEADEEKDFMEFKFKKMDEQDDIHTTYAKLYKISDKHGKLYRLATKKLSDKANQTIGVLQFENSLLKEQRSLKQNCFDLEYNWKGLTVQSSMRCIAFKNLLLIKLVWGMISLLLILPLLVLLCLSHLLII